MIKTEVASIIRFYLVRGDEILDSITGIGIPCSLNMDCKISSLRSSLPSDRRFQRPWFSTNSVCYHLLQYALQDSSATVSDEQYFCVIWALNNWSNYDYMTTKVAVIQSTAGDINSYHSSVMSRVCAGLLQTAHGLIINWWSASYVDGLMSTS